MIHQVPITAILRSYRAQALGNQTSAGYNGIGGKFGDYKAYTSLKLLAAVFGFPSPKDDIDGSEVGRVFWEEDDLERIATYCEKDVLAVVQLVQKYRRQDLFSEEQVVVV